MKVWQNVAMLLCIAGFSASACGGDAKKGSGATAATNAGGSGTSTNTSAADSTTGGGSGGSTSGGTTSTSSAQGGSGGTGTSSGTTQGGSGGDGTGGDGTAGAGGSGLAGSGGQPSETYCEAASDCTWGEIDHEILEASDCVCLFGCAFLPLNQETVMRRNQQYQSLCDPSLDGEGNPCPIDDCIAPPEPTCVDNTCGPEDPF